MKTLNRRLALIITMIPVFIGSYLSSNRVYSAEPDFRVFVLTNHLTDFSAAVSKAIARTPNQFEFLANMTAIPYQTTSEMISEVQSNICYVGTNSFVLVLGPASTDEALALDVKCTNCGSPRVLFVSPSVSSKQYYTNIHLIPGCLPDSERVPQMARNAPQFWKDMSAVFVGDKGAWCEQIYTNLCAQTNYFTIRAPPLYVDVKGLQTTAEYSRIAGHCIQDRVQLVFLALGDAHNVMQFLHRLDDVRGFRPYRPCVCLLGDYRFGPGKIDSEGHDQIIPYGYASVASILMASEAELHHEEACLFTDLDVDLLNLLDLLYARSSRVPPTFFCQINDFFTSSNKVTDTGLSPVSSHFIKFRLGGSYDEAVNLKWLTIYPFTGKPHWMILQGGTTEKTFFWAVARARVPWLADLRLTGLVLLAICAGWLVERRKRRVWLNRGALARWPRKLGWCFLIVCTFLAVFMACWYGVVNSSNMWWVFLTCVSPMALLPTLKHFAFTRWAFLDKFLEFPSNSIENFLDLLSNSKAPTGFSDQLKKATTELKKAVAESKGVDEFELLMVMWQRDLRALKSVDLAKKIEERFLPSIRPLDEKLNIQSRRDELLGAIAYTRAIQALPPTMWERFWSRFRSPVQIAPEPPFGHTGSAEPPSQSPVGG